MQGILLKHKEEPFILHESDIFEFILNNAGPPTEEVVGGVGTKVKNY